MDDTSKRIRRMYAAVGETIEADMEKLPAHVVSTDRIKGVIQDFSGGVAPEELENALHTLIAILASLEYHLRRWAHHNEQDPEKVTEVFRNSRPLQLVHDLWNNEKHGYPRPHGQDRSGVAPRLNYVRRVMRLRTQPHKGSGVTMTFGPGGVPVTRGDGSAVAVITGEILDTNGNEIGNAHSVLAAAIGECEALMREFGLLAPDAG